MITRKQIGEKLKHHRESNSITQDEITSETGMSRKQIIEIEKGTTNYGVDNLVKYLQAVKGTIIMGYDLGPPIRVE